MKSKRLIGIGIAAVFIGAMIFFYLRVPSVPPAESLLPQDTIYYCGSRSPLKIKAALAALDLKGALQESACLTEDESRIVSDWLGGLRGAHIGFRSFTLFPFILDAEIILDGEFDRSLTDILGPALQKRFSPDEPYRGVAVQKALIPFRGAFSLEIYVTKPFKNRTLITFGRRSLTGIIDRMIDGGSSLADNPVFKEMSSLKEMRKADVIQYADVQAYLRMLYDWGKSVPQPQFKLLADLIWKELRLADYGSSIAGSQLDKGTGCSFLRMEPANPLYRQFQYKDRLVFPYVPSNSCQFSFCRLTDPSEAFKQLTDMTVGLTKGVASVYGNRVMEPVEDFFGQLGLAAGGKSADLGQLLTGELGMWQAFPADPLKKQSLCFYIGINDAERVKKAIASFRLKVMETNGICTVAASDAIAWSVQPAGLLIANDPDYLRASLSAGEPSLTDTPEFKKLLKKLPHDYSSLRYTTYDQGIPVRKSNKFPEAFSIFMDLFKGFRQMSVSWAEEGMLTSYTAQQFNPDPQAVRAVLKSLFSAKYPAGGLTGAQIPSTSDDAATQNLIGDAFYYGSGVPQDYEKAAVWYRKAAEQGNADAQNSLGVCYAKGSGVPQDDFEAVRWYRKAAEQGNANAQNNMGYRYSEGLGVPKDDVEAVRWLQKSAAQGHSWAQHNLGLHYTEGAGVPKDCARAFALYSASAKQGFANAQYSLGFCYGNGNGVQQNYSEAVKWYRLAAEQGDDLGQNAMGICYANGRGVEQNYDEAARWYQKAAEQGNATAQMNLGVCYEKGQGVAKDMNQAVKWYQKAAEQNDANALANLGMCYANGKGGVEKDLQKAAACCKRAVELDADWHTLNNYAWFLETCEDESFRNYPEALRLAELSVAKEEQNFNLDTLAVAYDRNGQYAKAVDTQKRLIAWRQKQNLGKEVPAGMLKRLAEFERKAAEQ